MSLNVQVFGGDKATINLVLVHGWGHHAGVWREVVDMLEGKYRVYCIDLPGYGASTSFDLDSWNELKLVNDLAEVAPENAVWCGWSLGGMLASAFAAKFPERVIALVTVCSNPLFVQTKEWPCAMPRQAFHAFASAFSSLPEATLNRFQAMAVKGSDSIQAELRKLKAVLSDHSGPSASVLNASLELLSKLDVRDTLRTLAAPQLHLLGQLDTLVPLTLKDQLTELNEEARIGVIKGAAHVPLISHPSELTAHLSGFIEDVYGE